MGKLPASLFYWGDLIRDPGVRRCTHFELGVWMRILCIMFDAPTKGLLETGGIPWPDQEIAFAVGGDCNAVKQTIERLVTLGVASRNANGSLMNRRMYRDEKKRIDTKLRVQRFRKKNSCNEYCNADVRECTETEYETPITKAFTKKEVLEIYLAYPRKVGKSAALSKIEQALKSLASDTPARDAKWLLDRVKEFARSETGRGEYCPHPSTWFHQGRYNDDPAEWNRKNVQKPPVNNANRFKQVALA